MTETARPIPQAIAKQEFVLESLRNEITGGALQPGSRLPTQMELGGRFNVSGVTVQRALDRLMRDGFIITRGRSGTFVSTHPPHLHSYGFVFHDVPRQGRSRYHDLVEKHALRLQRSGDRRVRIFEGISGRDDSPASSELLSLLRSHQLAGLILVDGDMLLGTPLVEERGICRVAVMSRRVDTLNCPIVYPDITGMIDLAVDHIVQRGRRRVATLISVPMFQEIGQYLRHAMTARGLNVYERWQQIVPHEIPEAARNAVMMLMGDGPNASRPDALFVVDDCLIEAASSGLVASGVGVPHDVEVVAQCNFPWSTPVLPMTRIGFDTVAVVETAVNLIDMQRQHQEVSPVIKIPAILDPSSI